jgi:hypothetical protein
MSIPIGNKTLDFEWDQSSPKFAVSDLRRNWMRWLFWALLFLAGEAFLVTAFPSNPRHKPADPRLFFPGVFVGAFIAQFLMALLMWPVQVSNSQIILGMPGSRACRRYRFKKISVVRFSLVDPPGSILVVLKSGKEIEIFLNTQQMSPAELKSYLASAEISVSEGLT